jgi:hypothetical protein
MDTVLDFKAYPKMVPHMKSVQVSEIVTHKNVILRRLIFSFSLIFVVREPPLDSANLKLGCLE